MIAAASGEVQSVATVSVDVNKTDALLQQSRLAAGVGHPLALRLNVLQDSLRSSGDEPASGVPSSDGTAKIVIEQALASINQTTRERFAVAQTMLENAITAQPDNVDLQVALAALRLRAIQMVWYQPDSREAAEASAGALLERALRSRPNSIPVLDAYCRFLTTTNQFVESLVACARTLSFDPWNGTALYHLGLTQIQLGRFDDGLATFEQADRFDVPEVSRWTWLLGAGWTYMLMGRFEEALPWLERSLAITSASGRTHMLMAASYQQLGRTGEARAALAKGKELRPGSTAQNVPPPTRNTSPVYLRASERIMQLMVTAGLPEG
jgi:Tfp pilus assembly protein PilF